MPRARKPKKPDYLKQVLALFAAGDDAGLHDLLARLHPADIAHLLEGLSPDQRPGVWSRVDVERMGEVLLELPEAVRTELIKQLDDRTLVAAVHDLDTDDIADLIPELSDELIAEILFALDKQDRQRLDVVLPFAEDTAGGLMNVDAITVRENITLEVVLRYLRRRDELPEHTNAFFVVDRDDHVVGVLSVAKLLTSDVAQRVSQVMERELVKFPALTPDKEVAAAFERYNLISAPVVDENNHLLGRITVDDVVDVIREQADRQVMAPAGLSEDDDIFAPVVRTSRKRAIWLGINLVTAFIAAAVVNLFEHTIEKVAVLAVMMPIVAGMGGNAGTQTLTIVVRALAVGVVSESNARRVLMKELMVGVLNGMLWAVTVAVVTIAWHQNYLVALALALAMMINLVFAALSGVTIPILVRKIGVDPAVASGVILTTVTDVVGFFAFLGLATLFLL
ncbi:MAG: magnesium transporter [Candidatus Muproteobacteria bacterium RBG_16_64_10]|uniref:Magnesium transporter MgtE n=1 Tax=Candidatus Muproteobacteria bacterium RBG_16_64_10 TaxID=1817757 RepID=A0A1F6T4F2_9PROT|nr:MAG: magnesium transporter [Candidatus Muproteobacteria bacterium RBG_16_64_10]